MYKRAVITALYFVYNAKNNSISAYEFESGADEATCVLRGPFFIKVSI